MSRPERVGAGCTGLELGVHGWDWVCGVGIGCIGLGLGVEV